MGRHLLHHHTIGLLPVATMLFGPDRTINGDLEGTLDRLGVTQVVVCARMDCHVMLMKLLGRLEMTAVEVHFAPDVADLSAFCLRSGEMAGRPVFHMATSPFDSSAVIIKWLEDILGASLILLIFSPIMLLVAIAVKISTPGPIFFFQPRHGVLQEHADSENFGSVQCSIPGGALQSAESSELGPAEPERLQ